MKEIKFQVNRKDGNEIVGHERINEDGHWEHQYIKRQHWLLGAITMGQEYMGLRRRQFTGFKDKEGNEIYESDICLMTNQYNGIQYLGEIKWDGCGWIIEIDKGDRVKYCPPLDSTDIGQLNLRGNIYDNPELLSEWKASGTKSIQYLNK